MSQLTINGTFNPEIFVFEMLPPYIEEVQHKVQNGNLLIDTMAYKDRFQVTWPWLTQTEYNSLLEILYNMSSPYLTVEYETDGITRLWDGSSSFSSDISCTLQQDPIFDYFDYQPNQGLLVARATTNLFTNPNGDSGTLDHVEVEDSVTTKKNLTLSVSTEQFLWGTHSFKADNTNTNDYTPESGSAAATISDGREGYDTSGALQIIEGYTSSLLYNSHPFSTYSAQWNHSEVGVIGDTVYGPSYFYRDESISPGSNTYTFQFDLSYFNYEAASAASITLTISDLAGQSETTVLNLPVRSYESQQGYSTGWVSVTKTFVSSASSTLRCRVDFSNIDLLEDGTSFGSIYPRIQLVDKSYPFPWVDTSGGSPVVVSEYGGLLYKAPVSLWGVDGIHYEPPTGIGEMQSPQSISLWFRSTGWYYDTAYSSTFYILSGLDNSGHSGYYTNSLYIENGYLKLDVLGQSGQYLLTDLDWDQLSWHNIILVCHQYIDTSIGSGVARTKFRLYLDGTQVIEVNGPALSGIPAHFLGTSNYNDYERYFSLGRFFDLALTGVSNTIGNIAISEIVVGQVRFDINYSNNHPAYLIKDVLMENSDLTSYSSLIQYDESFSFYLQGDSTSAYIARCLFFKDSFTNIEYEKFVGSCYVYPTKRDHKYLHFVLGHSVVDSTTSWVTYNGGETVDEFTPDNPYSDDYTVNNWYRAFIPSSVFKWPSGGATSGSRRLFGVFVPMGEIYYVCGVQWETVGTSHTLPEGASPYCDGEQTNCEWDGSQYSSTSSRTVDYLTIPFPSSISASDSWTFMTSVTLTEMMYLPGDGVFLTIGDNSSNKLVLKYRSDITNSYLRLVVYDNLGVTTTYDSDKGWSQNTEHSIAVVRDVVNNQIRIYFDFVLVFTHTFTLIKTQFLNASNIYIGSTGPNDASPFYSSAFVRGISLWKKVLSLSEIQQYIPCRSVIPIDTNPEYLFYYGTLYSDLVLNTNLKINNDVKRLREKVLRQSIQSLKHVKNRANYYEVKIVFQES